MLCSTVVFDAARGGVICAALWYMVGAAGGNMHIVVFSSMWWCLFAGEA